MTEENKSINNDDKSSVDKNELDKSKDDNVSSLCNDQEKSLKTNLNIDFSTIVLQNDEKSPDEPNKTNKVRVQGTSSTNRTIERQNMGFNFFSKRFSLHSLGSSFEKKSLSSIPECEEYSTKARTEGSAEEQVNNLHGVTMTPKKKKQVLMKPITKKSKQNYKEHTIIPLLSKSENQSKKNKKTGETQTETEQTRINNRNRGNIGNQNNEQPTVYQIVCQTIKEYGIGKSILIILLVVLLCIGGYLFGLLMKTKN